MEHVDIWVKNVEVFNSYLKKFVKAHVSILKDRIYYIDRKMDTEFQADIVIDGTGTYMIPGLIDIHMHIESSMMTPQPFCERAGSCGVTTIVSEPHEMANVKGLDGIRHMIEAGKRAGIDVYYGIPSSVPSTGEELETTGAVIDFEAMKELMDSENVICVGEIMNYRKIIKENDLEITKFLSYLREKDPNYVIEGHCPALVDLELAKFLYLGIDADHTEHTLEEVRQRFENGMFVEIQMKMIKKEIFDYIKENHLYEHFGFVTDDMMADELYEKGHLNELIKEAVKNGLRIEDAIYSGTYTNARRMKLTDRGVLAPGKLADFILLTDLEAFDIQKVYKKGKQIFPKMKSPEEMYQFPKDFYSSVDVDLFQKGDFQISVEKDADYVEVYVMEVNDGSTQTIKRKVQMPVKNHRLDWENSDCMLAVVSERYGKNKNRGYGFVTGDCLKKGAAATTYFHDHHNLFVLGANEADMITVGNRVIELQGGIVTACEEKIQAELPLQVAGILSDGTVEEIGTALKGVRESLKNLGYEHYNPIMSLCTLGLPVSPQLKLTDKGLIDVKEGVILPLILS